jgi:hypothetical protein
MVKPTQPTGGKPRAVETAQKKGPRSAADHGLLPGKRPTEPPDKPDQEDERGRPRDTERHGA